MVARSVATATTVWSSLRRRAARYTEKPVKRNAQVPGDARAALGWIEKWRNLFRTAILLT